MHHSNRKWIGFNAMVEMYVPTLTMDEVLRVCLSERKFKVLNHFDCMSQDVRGILALSEQPCIVDYVFL
jgi:hypothetical protein